MSEPDELVPFPTAGGRVFSLPMRPGLGDCAPSGRLRLDALARWLQDVAYADVEDAGLADAAVWVIRRNRMVVHRWPRFTERCTVRTFCSGTGRMWAERRTAVHGADGEPLVETVALWVHLDPESWLPVPLTQAELAVYGTTGYEGRRVRSRLRHPRPPADAAASVWTFRAVDLDLANHVNNAAYWAPLEERLLAGGPEPDGFDAEIEYRGAAQPGEMQVLAAEDRLWIVGPQEELHASLAWREAAGPL